VAPDAWRLAVREVVARRWQANHSGRGLMIMKVLLVIDHLGLGGAQRQIVELACGLARRRHTVEIFNYFPQHDFFLHRVREQGIAVHGYRKGGGFSIGVVTALSSLLRSGRFDLVISFLNNPNLYAEIASLTTHGARLVVSERCSHHDDRFVFAADGRRLLHVVSDHVVTNSQTHAAWLRKKWWLRPKVSCIYNGLDLEAMAPVYSGAPGRSNLRLLAVGRICPQKNPMKLIAALRYFNRRHGYVPEVSWAGKRDTSRSGRHYAAQVDDLLASSPEISGRWHWLGEQSDMRSLMQRHDALIHPSLYEGLPNAVCEALAAGLPVLISNVCDHPLLVVEGERGFLFDPSDPLSIAMSIERAAALDADSWLTLSRNARKYAETQLGADKMVERYESLFINLTAQARRSSEGNA
jgi:glycosyltransferase involved in cell wall biosynthesis